MRCTLLATGLRGDIQPMIALGAGLRAAGADVRCAVPGDFTAMAQANGLDVFPLTGTMSALFGGPAGVAMRDRLQDAAAFQRLLDNYLSLFFGQLLREISTACDGADAILCGPWTRCAPSLAQALHVPVYVVSTYPVMHLPTRTFPNPFQPTPTAPPTQNRRTWNRALPAMRVGDGPLNAWRRDVLGLPPVDWRDDLRDLRRLPHLFGYSEAVLPRPDDWPEAAQVTGYWFLDDTRDYQPPAALADFLADGPPPVAIGFSSQTNRDPAALRRTVVQAVCDAGVRAVFLTGLTRGERETFPSQICAVDSVPHAWLCTRISAMVHHGGSGSTGVALRHGLPSGAVPFGYDQPLWGERLHQLGVGPAPLPAATLTADALAHTLRQLTANADLRAKARAIAARLSQEDGIATAVRRILG